MVVYTCVRGEVSGHVYVCEGRSERSCIRV